MKNRIILGAVMLLIGVLLGFAPTYSRLATAHQEVATLNQQLAVSKRANALNSFRNRAALLYTQVMQNNFTAALSAASKYLTDLQAFSDQTSDLTLKEQLGRVLGSRDAIIVGLAKADPATNAQIQELFLKLQNIN